MMKRKDKKENVRLRMVKGVEKEGKKKLKTMRGSHLNIYSRPVGGEMFTHSPFVGNCNMNKEQIYPFQRCAFRKGPLLC
jgi:hypothetical protein